MYDCVVMGGGPAGSTVAALVAQAGLRTLLVERERLPRFHVGESLMPATYWTLRRLGVLEQMKSSRFVPKVSVQFVSHTGKASQPFHFREHDPHESSQTWQVERSRFDMMLWENAGRKGAECRQATRVLQVLWDGSRACGVKVQAADGRIESIEARVVVDATGQQSLMASALRIKQVDPQLRKAALWTYYVGARRDAGEHAGATLVLHTRSKATWFWFIPLSQGVTSVGVVGDHHSLLARRNAAAAAFAEELSECPGLVERLEGARRIGRLHVAKEFSYTTHQAAGDGWVLVGDAWGFIDPVYSSGVFLALKSGELAADCVIEALQSGDTSAAQLGKWAPDFARGAQWMRQLVGAFYTRRFSFGRFVEAYPQHRATLTDLLIGRLFKPDVASMFRDMEPFLAQARTFSSEAVR